MQKEKNVKQVSTWVSWPPEKTRLECFLVTVVLEFAYTANEVVKHSVHICLYNN